jgi:trk system potassium uptake protein TrkH
VLYYHSVSVEAISFVIMVVGSLNFALHYAVWTGNRKEIYRNIEAVSFLVTSTLLFVMVTLEFAKLGVYPDLMAVMRKGYYNLISGHTTTGFSTVYARQFPLEWGPLAMVAMTAAMLFGGSACSTAGGFKGLRIGILVKGLLEDVRKLTLPSSAVVITKFHHVRDVVLEDRHVRNAALIVLSYMGIWFLGTAVGTYYGYPVMDSMFESASASGNVGLSSGVLSAGAPWLLKVTYIFLMWAGRLEFMSIYALLALLLQRGLRRR